MRFATVLGGSRVRKALVAAVLTMALLLAISLPALLLKAPAHAQEGFVVVVPNAQTDVEGDQGNRFPFDLKAQGWTSIRYQQVYAAGEIGRSGVIDRIAFRPDVTWGQAFSTFGISADIRLAHTGRAPDGLSTTFADNVGADETLVLDTADLSLASGKVNCSPCDFDIVIDIDDVFDYNGTDNLLLDVRIRNQPETTFFDVQSTSGDSASRAYSTASSNGVYQTSGIVNTTGLVTQFHFKAAPSTPVPGANDWGLAAMTGLLAVLLVWRLRRPSRGGEV